MNRGGKREGAGRPKSEQTKDIRVTIRISKLQMQMFQTMANEDESVGQTIRRLALRQVAKSIQE